MSEEKLDEPRIDKSVMTFASDFDDMEEIRYWQSRTPAERMEQLEVLRRINYGDKATERLQRVLELTQCEWG